MENTKKITPQALARTALARCLDRVECADGHSEIVLAKYRTVWMDGLLNSLHNQHSHHKPTTADVAEALAFIEDNEDPFAASFEWTAPFLESFESLHQWFGRGNPKDREEMLMLALKEVVEYREASEIKPWLDARRLLAGARTIHAQMTIRAVLRGLETVIQEIPTHPWPMSIYTGEESA